MKQGTELEGMNEKVPDESLASTVAREKSIWILPRRRHA